MIFTRVSWNIGASLDAASCWSLICSAVTTTRRPSAFSVVARTSLTSSSVLL
jgi:hypothetical protein